MRKMILIGLLISSLIAPGTAMASTTKPFKGAFEATTTPIDTQPGCELSWISVQHGEATHLGRFSGEAIGCGFNGIVALEAPPLPVDGAPPYFVSEYVLEGSWTAANGDNIYYTVEGLFVQSLENGASTTAVTENLVGGSGRFEGATGQVAADNIDKSQIEFDGWITYDAGNDTN